MIRNNWSWIEVDHSDVRVKERGPMAGLEVDLPDGKKLILRISSADLMRLARGVRKREQFSPDTKAFRKRRQLAARRRLTEATRKNHS